MIDERLVKENFELKDRISELEQENLDLKATITDLKRQHAKEVSDLKKKHADEITKIHSGYRKPKSRPNPNAWS